MPIARYGDRINETVGIRRDEAIVTSKKFVFDIAVKEGVSTE